MQHERVTLSADVADRLNRSLRSGRYADVSAVVDEALDALDERDGRLEDWLLTEVVPAYDALGAEPGRALSVAAVRAALAADEHAEAP